MRTNNNLNPLVSLVAIIAFVLSLFAMQTFADLINQILIALFIAITGSGLLHKCAQLGFSRALSVIVVILLTSSFLMFVAIVVGMSINDINLQLPNYQANLQQKTMTLQLWLTEYNIDISQITTFETIQPNRIFGLAVQLIQSVSSVFGSILTALFLAIFMMLGASSLAQKLQHNIGMSADRYDQIQKITLQVWHYLSIKTLTSSITGLLVFLLLSMLGINHALLWGILALMLNYVPNIGSIIAVIPAALLAWVQFDGSAVLWVVVGYTIINIAIGNWLEPKWMGGTLGLSMLTIFLSLLFWGWFLGIIGMFLSVPLTTVIKILLDQNPKSRWLATLMAG